MLDDFAFANVISFGRTAERLVSNEVIENNKKFREAVAYYNSNMPPSLNPTQKTLSYWMLIEIIQNQVDSMNQDAYIPGEFMVRKPMPTIIGGILEAGSCNAAAFKYKDRYHISINWGNFVVFYELFHKLFCHKEYLPWVGQPQDRIHEASSRPLELIYSDLDDSLSESIIDRYKNTYESILDPVRLDVCRFLVSLTSNAI